MQHIIVKINASPGSIDLADAIPVFHRWIQDGLCPELLIDVADYRHVPEGPGVILIAHEANYSLDLAGGRLGLLYNRKAEVGGDLCARLRQAFFAAARACRQLESEPCFQGKLAFDAGHCEVLVNDRLQAPNNHDSWQRLQPELQRFFTSIYGDDQFQLERAGEARERLRATVRSARPLDSAQLLDRLAKAE